MSGAVGEVAQSYEQARQDDLKADLSLFRNLTIEICDIWKYYNIVS